MISFTISKVILTALGKIWGGGTLDLMVIRSQWSLDRGTKARNDDGLRWVTEDIEFTQILEMKLTSLVDGKDTE